jgi:outer membrane protein assembly factor BamB
MATLGVGPYTYEASGENWGKLPDGWFYKEAASVAVDSQDQVYVFNRGNHPMIVFDREGNVLRAWGEGVFKNPHGVTVAPDDTVWCVDNSDHSIRRFSPTGELLSTLIAANNPAPPMSGKPVNAPTRVAVDPRNGDVLVADGYGNARVHRYSPDGRHLASWGEAGTELGQFNIVHDIAIDREGLIYIADRENRRIQVFDPEGRFQARWPDFSRAAAVHVAAAGGGEELVYVGEYFGGAVPAYHKAQRLGPRVSVLNRQGKVLARLSDQTYGAEPGRFWAPHAIATDSRGDVYVAEVSYAEFGRHLNPPQELRSLQKLVRAARG